MLETNFDLPFLIYFPLPVSISHHFSSATSVALEDFILEEKGLLLSRTVPLHPSDLAGGATSPSRLPRELSFWITKVCHLYVYMIMPAAGR